MQLRSNALQRKIESWCKFQLLYCPAVATLHALSKKDSAASSITPHLITLWLPSQINGRVPVDASLVNIEWKLRHAQAYESLDSLRHYLQVRAHLYKFKDRFVRGQGANTRARNTIAGVQAKIDAAAAEYRVAYRALLLLSSQVSEFGWKNELLLLKDEDIRDLSEGKAERLGKKQSEGRRTISWIWKMVPADDLENDEFLRESMFKCSSCFLNTDEFKGVRIEWCKSRARASRFTEEVALLVEEMNRVLRFFNWKMQDWLVKGELKSWPGMLSRIRAEGLRAYAHRQAALYRALAQNCFNLWHDIPAHVARMKAIILNPTLAKPDEFDRLR